MEQHAKTVTQIALIVQELLKHVRVALLEIRRTQLIIVPPTHVLEQLVKDVKPVMELVV